MRTSKHWSKTEDELLINNYQTTKKEILELLPNRTPAAINIRASYLGLKKDRNEYVQGQLDILLENTHESLYWIGFILADGHISPSNRLKFLLSSKDSNQVKKLQKYLKIKIIKYNKICTYIDCQDKYIIPKICKKFDINSRKTYNPPRILPNISKELIISMLIGYIDGDGYICKQYKRKDSKINIHCHSSWLLYLNMICNLLIEFYNIDIAHPAIKKDGYLNWNICNHKMINSLKDHVVKYKLPALNRKWDIIN